MQDFDSIYKEYFSYVFRFVVSLCKDPELAEEITQETFLKLLKILINMTRNINLAHGSVI